MNELLKDSPTTRAIASMVPVVIAFFNLVLAGQAARSSMDLGKRVAVALGALGISGFAVAWLLASLLPSSIEVLRVLASLSAILAVSGYFADALSGLPKTHRWWILMLVLVPIVYRFYTIDLATSLRLTALVLAIMTPILMAKSAGAPAFRRRLGQVSLLGFGAYSFFTLLDLASGRPMKDPSLAVILLCQLWALVYVARTPRSVARTALTTAVVYAGFVGAAAAVILWVGSYAYGLDASHAGFVVAAGLAAALSLAVTSEIFTQGLIRMMFPDQVKLTAELGAKRGELEAMRRRLEEREKLAIIGELSARVAHDIKNPLAPIRSYAQMMQTRVGSIQESQREFFERALSVIVTETDRIDGHVQQLLATARSGTRPTVTPEPMDVSRVIREAVWLAEAAEHNIVVRVEDTVTAMGSAEVLRGVLTNLIENACEAVGTSGGRIEVSARTLGQSVEITVSDEGPGLPPEVESRAFEPFFTTKPTGTGLGLAIAKSGAEAMKGTLHLQSRRDRTGALATLILESGAQT